MTEQLKILVVQHSERAPGGVFMETLKAGGADVLILRPFDGDVLPDSPGRFDGLVVLGGPEHAASDEQGPHFRALMDLMRRFDGTGRPVAGICLGCQLLARAYGGHISRLGSLEFGFIDLQLTEEGAVDPVMGGREIPAMMEFHEDTFDLPENAVLLVQGENCRNQGFRVGTVSYGFQFHLEVDEPGAREWLEMFRSGDLGSYAEHRQQFGASYITKLNASLPGYIEKSIDYCRFVAGRWLCLVRAAKESPGKSNK